MIKLFSVLDQQTLKECTSMVERIKECRNKKGWNDRRSGIRDCTMVLGMATQTTQSSTAVASQSLMLIQPCHLQSQQHQGDG